MKRTRRVALWVAGAVCVASLGACGSDDDSDTVGSDTASSESASSDPASSESASSDTASSDTASSDTASSGGQDGGTLVVVTVAEPETLMPDQVASSSATMPVMRNVIQTLVNRDTLTAELVPELATSWEQVEPNRWRFDLAAGVVFHDDTPWNAENAVKSLEWSWDAERLGSGGFIGGPATFEVVDDDTIDIVTESPDPIVPARLTMVGITSPAAIAAGEDALSTNPIGTGPYRFEEWKRGVEIVLVRFDKSPLAASSPYSEVRWLWRTEPDVRATMVETGEADITNDLTLDQCQRAPQCASVAVPNVQYIRADHYNQTVLGDTRVRQAIAKGIDRNALAEAGLYDGAEATDNMVIAGTVGYVDEEFPQFTYDPDVAKSLVAEAAADGVAVDTPIALKYPIDQWPGIADIAAAVAADLQEIGLNVTATGVTTEDFVAGFYMNYDGRVLTTDLAPDRNEIYVSATGNELMDSALTAQNGLTCAGVGSIVCDPDLDAAFEQAQPLLGDEREAAFQDLWRQAADNVELLPLAPFNRNWAYTDDITLTPRADSIIPLWENP